MEDCKTRLKTTTDSGKECLINTKLLPYFEEMPINKIEPATIRKWQNVLMEDESDYSQTYLKTIHNQIPAIFNFASTYYKLSTNPARICGSMGKKNADSMLFWTVNEFRRFIPFVSDNPISKLAFKLLF